MDYDETEERAEAEFHIAMHEYYEKPETVQCGYCGLIQTASLHLLTETGWQIDRLGTMCFQAHCKRDRMEATYPQAEKWLVRERARYSVREAVRPMEVAR